MAENEQHLIQFTADLEAFAKQIGVELGTVVKKTTLDLLGKIVARTPVKTGRARGSWIVSLDTSSETSLPPGDYPAYHESSSAANAAVSVATPELDVLTAPGGNPYRTVWISNNLPYIQPLNDGHSTQAPAGYVEMTVAEVEADIQGTSVI